MPGSGTLLARPTVHRSLETHYPCPYALLTDDADLLEAGPSPHNLSEVREAQAAKVDANFFNKFDDDFDESDMKPSA